MILNFIKEKTVIEKLKPEWFQLFPKPQLHFDMKNYVLLWKVHIRKQLEHFVYW